MDTFVFLLTIFAIALVARWPVLRHVAPWRRPRSGVLEDVELGLARVTLPRGWRPSRLLNEQAALQALHPVKSRYLIVISESLADFEHLDLAEFSAETIDTLTSELRVLARTGPQDRQVGAFPARQVEFEAICDGTLITYLHTTIQGARGIHQVIGWAARSQYSRPVFESLVDGFAEVPGPVPERVCATEPVQATVLPPRGSGRRIGF